MLFPKKVKFRKWQTGRSNPKRGGVDTRGAQVSFGSFGLKALASGRLRSQQIEAARKAMSRLAGKTGKIWIRVFPDKPITKKPAEVRMGKGKGAVDHWVAVVRPGRILFEVANVPKEIAQDALRRAAAKLGLKTRFVERVEQA